MFKNASKSVSRFVTGCRWSLVQYHSQDDDDQNDGQDEQKNACLAPCALLVITRLLQVDMGTSRSIMRNLNVLLNDIELSTLFVDHMRNIAE